MERRIAELEDVQREWLQAFDSISDGISIHSKDYDILFANDALCKLLGKTKEEIIGKKCYEVFHRQDHPPVFCPFENVKITRTVEHAQAYEPALKLWLAISSSPIFSAQGNIERFIHIIRDMTDSKKIEENLQNKIDELERFNRVAIGRELKMVELKQKIRQLEGQLGK